MRRWSPLQPIATRGRVLKRNKDVAEGHSVSLLARSLLELRYDPLADAGGYR